jgi:hypothetical protein
MYHVWGKSVYYRIFVGNPEGKRPLGRPRRRWKDDDNNMNFQDVECGGMDWTDLTQDRDRWWALVNPIMNFPVP